VLFSGPRAYISPTWYEAEQAVPTWNSTAVHAYGRVEVVEEKGALLDIVQRSVQVYERPMPRPWSFDPSSTFVGRLLAQTVGFRIEVEKIEGKFKLNQHHPVERRLKVVRALAERGDENAQAVAAMMRAMLPAEGCGRAEPLRDVRQGAGGHHAQGVTLPPVPVVPNRSGLPEIPAAAGRAV
jgi:transcriptional regulator